MRFGELDIFAVVHFLSCILIVGKSSEIAKNTWFQFCQYMQLRTCDIPDVIIMTSF